MGGNCTEDETITVVGLGYIGLPTATLFASVGYKVHGFDINEKILEGLKQKNPHIHFHEPDMRGLLYDVLEKGDLVAVTEVGPSDVFIICVPTPAIEADGGKKADLSYVEAASRTVAKVLKPGNLVIVESTVPPGTTEEAGRIIASETGLLPHEDFDLAHCPERVFPGKILYELRTNDRVVGAANKKASERTRALYSRIVTQGHIHETDILTAELCKLVENTYRDVNIAFANELSMICKDLDIDVRRLIDLANRHPRVNILNPGPGVGGHCIAVDPWFIVEKFPEKADLIRTARTVNDKKPEWAAEQVKKDIQDRFGDKTITIGILGLAYKADIDDTRESPGLVIAGNLKKAGHKVIACEPNRDEQNIEGCPNMHLEDVLKKSDYVVITTGHRQFRESLDSICRKPFFDAAGVTA
jgi:UDP-N-acetyl-D-mannosaminuronic acid dehydrogenase